MDILTDKKYKFYEKMSRYQSQPIYYDTYSERYRYGLNVSLSDQTAYIYHTVQFGDTLDSLALYYYNNPTHYWIIADFNRIKDPFQELEPGTKIKIPTFSTIEFQ